MGKENSGHAKAHQLDGKIWEALLKKGGRGKRERKEKGEQFLFYSKIIKFNLKLIK